MKESDTHKIWHAGFISDKSLLPVTRLHFGRILSAPARGLHTLSRLQCFGRQFIISEFNRPSTCMDLWRTGHTHSGFYFVESDNDIKHVFCDMSDVPGQSTPPKTVIAQEKFVKITSLCMSFKNEFEHFSIYFRKNCPSELNNWSQQRWHTIVVKAVSLKRCRIRFSYWMLHLSDKIKHLALKFKNW